MTKRKLETTTPFVKAEDIKSRAYFLLDASGKTLGRFASEVAKILRGKHKTTYTPHVDTGDGVIIINAAKIAVTGNKRAQKEYVYNTGFPGGQRRIPYDVMIDKKPDYILRHAIMGMMPRNTLTEHQLKRLRIFGGDEHDMEAQQPIRVEV